MYILNTVAILITLTALFAYANHRFIRLPMTIGVMVLALLFSLVLLAVGKFSDWQGTEVARDIIGNIDFNTTLLHGMLSFLLFAGALHINLDDLAEQKWVILILATFGVVLSTFLIGAAAFYGLSFIGIEMPFIYCLLFGALISPTDPIAVLATLKTIGVSKNVETKIAGESLFNDGVGVVVFLVLLGIASGDGQGFDPAHAALLFCQEAIGGILFGFVMGYISYYLLKKVDQYQVEILITLALVMGGYTLAMSLHTSGPIAVVVAGLFIGNHGRLFAMTDKTREHLDTFWELIDEILNALLFVLIGLEVLALDFTLQYLLIGLAAIPVVLLARTLAVAVPVNLLRFKREFSKNIVRILVWGGIRGGISVALALSLPPSANRDLIVAATYIIVIFSIVVQGLTIGRVVSRAQDI